MEELRDLQSKLYTEIESVKAANKEAGEYGKLILAKYAPEEWEKRFAKLAADYTNINLKLNAIMSPNEDIITAFSQKYELKINADNFRSNYWENYRTVNNQLDDYKMLMSYLLRNETDIPTKLKKYHTWESQYKEKAGKPDKPNPFDKWIEKGDE